MEEIWKATVKESTDHCSKKQRSTAKGTQKSKKLRTEPQTVEELAPCSEADEMER